MCNVVISITGSLNISRSAKQIELIQRLTLITELRVSLKSEANELVQSMNFSHLNLQPVSSMTCKISFSISGHQQYIYC